ncbi:MAG TPA: sigma-70 family RNA polymerase sigma factor [Parasegetibacter sp.]
MQKGHTPQFANNTPYDESGLLQRTAEGDEYAFSDLIRHYTPIIYRQLLTFIKNAHQAQELTQDVFVSVWRNREKLRTMDNFAGYIYVITRNMAIRALRSIAEQSVEVPDNKFYKLLQEPDSTLELKELKAILLEGIQRLPERRRQVFQLSRIELLSYEEIATRLNISKSAVKQHIIAAMVFLRTYLKKHADITVVFFLPVLHGIV